MALIFITNSSECLTNGEKYILEQKIKKIFGCFIQEDVFIYIQPVINNLRPDFIIVSQRFGICIIEVKDWSDDFIEDVTYSYIETKDLIKRKNPILQIRQYKNVIESNLSEVSDFIDTKGRVNIPINCMILFPYLSDKAVQTFGFNDYHDSILVYGKTRIRTINFNDFFLTERSKAFSSVEVDIVRSVLFPENQLFLNEYSDTDILKTISELSGLDKEQEEYAKKISNGHFLVSGIPGSGKTAMLLTRAIHLLKDNPSLRILILTYSKSLALELDIQLKRKITQLKLSEKSRLNIEIMHFHKLCKNLIGTPSQPKCMSPNDYYRVFWPDKVLQQIVNVSEHEKYDHILIDEYQDFDTNWFKVVKRLCKTVDGTENLFLAGDRLQKIYKSQWVSFKDVGINIIGRSKLLKTPYRTNKGHLDLALRVLAESSTLRREIKKYYELDKIDTYYDVENLRISVCTDERLIEKIFEFLCRLDVLPSDVLILFPHREDIKAFKSKIKEQRILLSITSCTLLTYHEAKGFEAKYSILCKIDTFKNHNLNRKLLYVGMTRSSKKLIIHANKNIGFMKEIINHIRQPSDYSF